MYFDQTLHCRDDNRINPIDFQCQGQNGQMWKKPCERNRDKTIGFIFNSNYLENKDDSTGL